MDLPLVEDSITVPTDQLIDLRKIDEGRRSSMWHGCTRSMFPRLSVKVPPVLPAVGSISRVVLGAAELFSIDSGPVEVTYRPPVAMRDTPQNISLMVQRHGTTAVTQGEHTSALQEGDICLLDEASAFRLVGEDASGILFLRLPRSAAVSRYPHLDRLYAEAMHSDDTGTRLLAETLLRLPHEVQNLAEVQRSAVMGALIHMLGVAGPVAALRKRMNWRVTDALYYIEMNLAVVGLTAHDVARHQRISRRRLDEIMIEATGESITGYLWRRRLEQAAADLRDLHRSKLSISQIAYANGFGDAAHFSRAFKRRYSVPPGEWRLN